MFPKDSMFFEYKRFSNLKDLMVRADPNSIKPLREIDENLVAVIVRKYVTPIKAFLNLY